MAETNTGEITSSTPSSDHYSEELRRIGTDVLDDPSKNLSVQPSPAMEAVAQAAFGRSPSVDIAVASHLVSQGGVDAAHRFVDGIKPNYAPEVDPVQRLQEIIAGDELRNGPSFRLKPEDRERVRAMATGIREKVGNVFRSVKTDDAGEVKVFPIITVAATALLVSSGIGAIIHGATQGDNARAESEKNAAIETAIQEAATTYSPDEIFVGSGVVGPDGNNPSSVGEAILGRNQLPVDPASVDFEDGTFIKSSYGPGIVQPGETIDVVLEDPDGDGKLEPIVQRGDLNPSSSEIPGPTTR